MKARELIDQMGTRNVLVSTKENETGIWFLSKGIHQNEKIYAVYKNDIYVPIWLEAENPVLDSIGWEIEKSLGDYLKKKNRWPHDI